VVCLDEKPVTLHADVRPCSAAVPGREARIDNEYERCELPMCSCAVEPKAGHHFTFPTPDAPPSSLPRLLPCGDSVSDADTIHLIVDNLNIHRRKSLTDLLGPEVGGEVWDRFTVHYTPVHGSWLNQAESKSASSPTMLGRRRIPDSRHSLGKHEHGTVA